jgi:S-adenosylmethionine:tRNA ribosyltransferase-isomerase
VTAALSFALPPTLEAGEPPPVRDEVRLMVARPGRRLVHARFLDLPEHLRPGDLLVANASATLPAALTATRADGRLVDLHLSTPEPSGKPDRWVVELRRDGERVRDGSEGETLLLPGAATVRLVAPYLSPGRLWVADLDLPARVEDYLGVHGEPIRYAHETTARPLADHQTTFAEEPGSAEMPSAGRPFTERALTALRARGIQVAKIVLHTGVSSLERGIVAPHNGWTGLTISPETGVKTVDGLLTGWHEPDASHLLMLEAIAGRALLERSYASALARGYRWHEFGDLHLLMRH